MPGGPQHIAAIRLVVAEPVALLRSGYRTALTAEPDLHVIGEAGDAPTMVTLVRRLSPRVVLVNPAVAGADRAAVVRSLTQLAAQVRVLVVGDEPEPAVLVRAGAAGVLPADIPSTALVAAVRAIAADVQVFAAPTVAAMLAGAGDGSTPGGPVDATAPEGLTDREREVLVQLGRGLTNAQIAQQLRVSETTVKTHVGHVLAKLGLRDRAQAVVFVYESGLIRPGGPVGLPGVSAG